jgi:hypothetical protein
LGAPEDGWAVERGHGRCGIRIDSRDITIQLHEVSYTGKCRSDCPPRGVANLP